MTNTKAYTTIILTGGFGTRLSSLVPNIPKILAPIGNSTFLNYLFEWFSHSLGDNSDIILATGHLHDQIQNFVIENNINVSVSCESSPLGTLGALLQAIEHAKYQHILVLNGDTIFDINFFDMFTLYLDISRPLLTLKPNSTHLDSPGYFIDNDRCIWSSSYSTHFSLGAFFVSKNFLKEAYHSHFSDYRSKQYMIDANLLSLLQPTPFVVTSDNFLDIGTPESFVRAQIQIPLLYPNL